MQSCTETHKLIQNFFSDNEMEEYCKTKIFSFPKSDPDCQYVWVAANVNNKENVVYQKKMNFAGYPTYAAETYEKYLKFLVDHKEKKGGQLYIITGGKITDDVVKNTSAYNQSQSFENQI